METRVKSQPDNVDRLISKVKVLLASQVTRLATAHLWFLWNEAITV